MSSPYQVSSTNRVNVIKSIGGYKRLRTQILKSMYCDESTRYGSGPEGALIHYFDAVTRNTILQSRRTVVSLKSSYKFVGSERFDRTVVLDFCCEKGKSVNFELLTKFVDFHLTRLNGCEVGEDFKLFANTFEEIPLE